MRSLTRIFDFHAPLPCDLADRVEHSLDLRVRGLAEARRAKLHSRLDQRGVLFDRRAGVGFHVAQDPALALRDGLVAELLRGDLIAPFAECALSKFLNVALVDQGDSLAARLKRAANGVAHQPLGAEDGDGLDADARVGADLFLAALQQIVVQERDQPRRVLRAFFEFDARIHIFSVFAEDDDIELFRMLHRAGHALVVLHRPHAGIEVENLAQSHIERADAAANGRGERALDGDAQIARRGYRVVRQPIVELPEGFFAGEDLKPANRALAAVGFFNRGVEDTLRGLPDIAAGAVAFDKWNDGMVGNFELPVAVFDRLAVFGQFQPVVRALHGFREIPSENDPRMRLTP